MVGKLGPEVLLLFFLLIIITIIIILRVFFPQLALRNTCAMAYDVGSGAPDNVEDDLGLLPQKQARQ